MTTKLLTVVLILLPTLIESASLVSNAEGAGNIKTPIDHTYHLSPTNVPCNLTLWGDWASRVNVSFRPNPPAHNKPLKVHLEFYAFDDIWFASARGNATRLSDGWVYAFNRIICDNQGICPIRKGETRVFDEVLPSPSKFLNGGTYTVWGEVENQDGVIFGLLVENCEI